MKKFKAIITGGLLFAPFLAFAQNTQYVSNFLTQIKTILSSVMPVLVILAIVLFFVELIKFISNKNKGDAAKVKDARNGIIYALVALFIMLSFLGVIRILQSATGTGSAGDIQQTDVPRVNF